MAEHAVIVKFKYAADSLEPLAELENRIEEVIEQSGVGEFDGHEIATDLSDGTLYMYGADAEALFQVVRPILASSSCFRTANAVLRFGPPEDGVPECIEELRSPDAAIEPLSLGQLP